MRRVERGQQQRQTRLLTAGQASDLGFHLFRHQAEPGETGAQPRRRLVRAFTLDMLKRGFVDMQFVDLVLGEEPDAQLGRPGDLALHQGQSVGQDLGQGRLALAIAAQQGDAVILVDPQVQTPQDDLVAIAGDTILDPDDGGRQFLGFGEGKDGARGLFGRRDLFHLFQHLDAGLCLFRLGGLGLEPVHEALQVGAARLLLAGLGDHDGTAFGALAGELVVGAGIERQLAVIEMQDRAHGPVQQPAIVRDDQHGMGVALQVAFQPERAFEIEVVGRFVEQQDVGLREQHTRQRHAHPPAAREGGAGHVLFGLGKAQALEDRAGAALGGPGVDIGETGLDVGNAGGIGGGFRLGHQAGAFGIGGQNGIEKRDLVARHLLRDAADAGAFGHGDRAGIDGIFAADQLEQGGLAGAVAPDDADLVAFWDGDGGVLDQGTAGHGERYVLNAQHEARRSRGFGRGPEAFVPAPRGPGAFVRVVWAAGGAPVGAPLVSAIRSPARAAGRNSPPTTGPRRAR